MDVFEAVAEPTRRQVLDLLADGDRHAGELAAAFPQLSQPAVSRHLRVLREVGLVDFRVDAQRRVYRLQADQLAELDVWVSRYREFWTNRIDALEAHLAQQHRTADKDQERHQPG